MPGRGENLRKKAAGGPINISKIFGVSLGNRLNLKNRPGRRGAEPRAAACVGDALRSAANQQHFGSAA
jgi:hypothetical protein